MKVYLDHAATTPVDPRVLAEMVPFFSKKFGNASSLHSFGREAKAAVELARTRVAKLISALPEEIFFTSGGTEADNLAIFGAANKSRGKNVLCSAIEHPAVLEACAETASHGFDNVLLPVDREGVVDLAALRKEARGAAFISVMHANNEVGTIEPVEEISEIARDAGAIFHCDAVQSVGKIQIDVRKFGVDLLSISSHKIYGPKGVGALFVRKGTKINPILFGGGHEKGLRSGTENVAGLAGFGKACELAGRELSIESTRLKSLSNRLLKKLLKIPGTVLNGAPVKRLPNNIHVNFEAIEGEGILLGLDSYGVAVSTGSACSSKKLQASHVLLAMGRKPEHAHGSIRYSLGKSNNAKQIDFAAEKTAVVVEGLRKMSPFKVGEDLSKFHFTDDHEDGVCEGAN